MSARKRSYAAYNKDRRLPIDKRKQRRFMEDMPSNMWAREASILESKDTKARRDRVLETARRNVTNQTTTRTEHDQDETKKATRAIKSDSSAFYKEIDDPLSLICGSCGALNNPKACRWRRIDYDAPYFAPLIQTSTDDAPRGIYTAAIVTDGHEERVSLCDQCDKALRRNHIPKYSVASGFCIGRIPNELAVLNNTEARLIGLGVSFTSCYKIRGSGQDCSKGHTISYWNDAPAITLSLPRSLSSAGIIRLCTRGADGKSSPSFTIRPHLVRAALLWLISHNPLYKNVSISEAQLELLRHEVENPPTLLLEHNDTTKRDNVNDQDADTCDFEDESESFEMETGGAVTTESDQILQAIHQKQRGAHETEIDCPTDVINEYSTRTLMQACFPVLFPFGTGGFHATTFEKRSHTYDMADFCGHLMRWHDRRFVIHPNFKFFCLNIIQRRQVDGLTRCADNHRRDSVMQDSSDFEGDSSKRAMSILRQLRPYFRSVRGSGLYWQDVRNELMGLIGNRVLQNPYPTFFFTLSAADTVWPDFFRACDPSLTLEQAGRLPAHVRRRLLNQNPDIASRHFYRRFKALFDNVINGKSQPLGKVVDYFWRVEFQRRGSPHIHGLLWVENAPDVMSASRTETGRASLAKFVDRYISTQTFRQSGACSCAVCEQSKLAPGDDILTKRPPAGDDPQAELCDLSRLVSRVQQHVCFEGSSCRVKTPQCRFSFPKQIQQATSISYTNSTDGGETVKIHSRRDDPYTNGFNPHLLQIWRANMDIKLVGNVFGAAEYTAAYVSKAEPDTVKFRDAIACALEKNPNSTHLSALRRVANASIATREVSAQEALWILQRNMPMFGRSRGVLKVKSSRHARRHYRVDMATCLHEMETHEPVAPATASDPRIEALEAAYAARPNDSTFNNMTYRHFCEHFDTCDSKPSTRQRLKRWLREDNNGYIKERQRPQAVMKSPRFRVDATNPDYCFSELFFNVPWRDLHDIPDGDESCVEAFATYQKDEYMIRDIERQFQMDLQTATQQPTMIGSLAETQWTFTQVQELEMEKTHDDTTGSIPPTVYDEELYDRAKTFISQVVKPYMSQKKHANDCGRAIEKSYLYPIDTSEYNMTAEQWVPFSLWMNQSRQRRRAIVEGSHCEPLRMILNGEGGSGKSWLIKHIVKDVHKVWDELSTSVRRSKRVLLMAHHGTAAFNIKGVTICSAMGFGTACAGFNQPYKSLEDSKAGLKTLRTLQDKYRDVHMVIIDEYSVISCGMLHWIDRRMREIWPACRELPFGGRDIILAGDMGQLPSVSPASLATPLHELKSETQIYGRQLWLSISNVCTLKSQQRGLADPEWYDALQRLREMDETDADLRLFNTRHFAIDDMPSWTSSATHVSYRNSDVDEANGTCLQRSNENILQLAATHTILPNLRANDVCQPIDAGLIKELLTAAEEPNQSRDRVIPPTISLATNIPVTITNNLLQEAGLCNGTSAVVYGFIHSSNALPIILIEVKDKYLGPSFIPGTPNIVPVVPQSISWLTHGKTLRTTRTGLPLRLAFAMTIHKVQGLTCKKLVFNPIAIPITTFAYVALSRVRHREDVVLTAALVRINTQQQQKTKAIRRAEWDRLNDHDNRVRQTVISLVADMKSLARLENRYQSER